MHRDAASKGEFWSDRKKTQTLDNAKKLFENKIYQIFMIKSWKYGMNVFKYRIIARDHTFFLSNIRYNWQQSNRDIYIFFFNNSEDKPNV